MKIIRAFFVLIAVWTLCLYLLFGPAIINKVAKTPEIMNSEQLSKYHGYTVEKLDSDWFGNWVIIKKGRQEVVLKCDDSIFSKLSVTQRLGH